MNNKTYSGMSDDFENSIHQRMQDFGVTPDPQIWERVAAALPPEKKRRRFAIWWWIPIATCLGGGTWLMIDGLTDDGITNNKKNADQKWVHQNSEKQSAVIIAKDTIVNYTVQKPVNKKELPADKKQLVTKENIPVNKSKIVENDYSITQKKQPHNTNKKSKNSIEIAGEESVVSKRNVQRLSSSNVGIVNILNNSVGNFQLHKADSKDSVLSIVEPLLPVLNAVNIPVPHITAQTDTAAIKKADTLVIKYVKEQPAKTKIKLNKAEWNLSFAVGRSTLNGGISNDEKASNQSNFNSPILGSGIGSGSGSGATTNTGSFMEPNAGISFSAGIAKKYSINKYWSWHLALNYELLTSKQIIGRKNDSLLLNNFFADAYSRSLTSSSATSASIYTNKVHRLQILPRINYTLNSSSSSPVSFSVGVSFAYHFSNNILLHDYRTGYYIRSASLSNRLMFGSLAGFDVFINKKINAGLVFQHDFTNVGKNKIGSSFHWNDLQLNVGIPLSKHK